GLASAGCDSGSRSNTSQQQTAQPPAAEAPATSATVELTEAQKKAAETLRATGAKLAENSAGQIIEVHLGDIEATDALAAQIALIDSLQKLTIRESAMTIDGWQALGKLHALQQLDLRDC